jgi:hypothetical protein
LEEDLKILFVMQDVAIAFGYNNIVKTTPKTLTVAQQLPINKLTDQLREAVAQVMNNFSYIAAQNTVSTGFASMELSLYPWSRVVLLSHRKCLIFMLIYFAWAKQYHVFCSIPTVLSK